MVEEVGREEEVTTEVPPEPPGPGRVDRFLSTSWEAVRNEYRLQLTENKAGLAMAVSFLIVIGLLTLAALT